MKNVHLVISDLFLPHQLAGYACGDLRFPSLEKLLARAQVSPLYIDTLEGWLCEHFGADALEIAPLTLRMDGMQPEHSYWLRADPVNIVMQGSSMVMQGEVELTGAEAAQLCTSLNTHFTAEGLHFIAPHPQRWYLQLENAPAVDMHPLPQVVGTDIRTHLPYGTDELRWHGVFNEIQMLFYEHAVNQVREACGKPVVNAVWFWGGGKYNAELKPGFSKGAGDSELAQSFALAADMPFLLGTDPVPDSWLHEGGDLMLVCESPRVAMQKADMGKWRIALQQFETGYTRPMLNALAAGLIDRITLDVLSTGASRSYVLTRAMLRKFWCLPKPLLHYTLA